MKCHNCGAELAEGVSFCCYCGSQLSVPPSPEAPDAAIQTPDAAIAPENPAQDSVILPPAPEPKPKKPVGLIIAACIAAVLTVVVVLGLCTNWFGFYGPGTRIATAAKNTFEKGNFTVELTIEYGYQGLSSENYVMDMTIQVDLDMKKQELMLYGETTQDLGSGDYISYIAIIDGYSISGYKYSGQEYYTKTDISEDLEEFFEAYEDTKDTDWDDLFDLIEENTGEDLEDIIDLKAFKKCLRAYSRSLNSNKWLKENAGFSTHTSNGVRYYEFEPDLYKFSKASLELFEDAFQDEDDYEDSMEAIKDSRSTLNDTDLELLFGIKRSKLVEIEIKYETESNGINIAYEMEFTHIGSTDIDVSTLEEMLSKAQ